MESYIFRIMYIYIYIITYKVIARVLLEQNIIENFINKLKIMLKSWYAMIY